MSREDLYLLADRKGRKYLVRLRPGGRFSHHRGTVDHEAIRAAGPGGAIVMMLDLEPGARVLEAGTGSGGLTLFLARAVGREGEVVSYEKRPSFLARARANVAAWGAENVRFLEGDFSRETWPRPSSSPPPSTRWRST